MRRPPPEATAADPLAREFADYLRSVEGLAELTVDAYAAEARRYVDYLVQHPDAEAADPAPPDPPDGPSGVISYLMARQAHGAGSGTLAKAVSALRAWYRFVEADRPESGGLGSSAASAQNPGRQRRASACTAAHSPRAVGGAGGAVPGCHRHR